MGSEGMRPPTPDAQMPGKALPHVAAYKGSFFHKECPIKVDIVHVYERYMSSPVAGAIFAQC